MAPRLGELQRRVLAALATAPDIPDALAVRLGEDRLAIRPRFTELAALGLIVKSGERRNNGSGRKAAVWKVVA
jgi:predicted ArsR family transcriptional regulator